MRLGAGFQFFRPLRAILSIRWSVGRNAKNSVVFHRERARDSAAQEQVHAGFDRRWVSIPRHIPISSLISPAVKLSKGSLFDLPCQLLNLELSPANVLSKVLSPNAPPKQRRVEHGFWWRVGKCCRAFLSLFDYSRVERVEDDKVEHANDILWIHIFSHTYNILWYDIVNKTIQLKKISTDFPV